MKAPVPTEEQEQRALAMWLDANRILWTHPANGANKSKAQAGIFKAMGQKAGVPDVLIFDCPRTCPHPGGLHPPVGGDHECAHYKHGVAIELKRRGSSSSAVSPEQERWLADLQKRGWIAFIARGADDAITELKRYGYGTVPR